jgi:hypothetical protein
VFSITHRHGEMERDPPLDAISALIQELGEPDSEQGDVSVQQESGWSLSAYPRGLLVYEHLEGEEIRPLRNVPTGKMLALFVAVAQGAFQRLEQEDWIPGQP